MRFAGTPSASASATMVVGVRGVGIEHRLQHGLRPEPHLAGRRLEDGVIHGIGQRHRQRAGGEAGVFGRRGKLVDVADPAEVDTERQVTGHR